MELKEEGRMQNAEIAKRPGVAIPDFCLLPSAFVFDGASRGWVCDSQNKSQPRTGRKSWIIVASFSSAPIAGAMGYYRALLRS